MAIKIASNSTLEIIEGGGIEREGGGTEIVEVTSMTSENSGEGDCQRM